MLCVLCLCAGVATGLFGCSGPKRSSSDVLLFTRVRVGPGIGGYISTVAPETGRLKDVVVPAHGRMYESVSANDLSGPAISLVRDYSVSRGQPRLYRGTLGDSTSWRAVPGIIGLQGSGFISPDNREVLFAMAKPEQATRYSLWMTAVSDSEMRQLTHPDENSWDTGENWHPDNRLYFLLE